MEYIHTIHIVNLNKFILELVMVFNATFNNISAILWQSVLLVKETGVPGNNHRPVASHWHTLSHNVVWSTPHLRIGTDCIGKSLQRR